MRRTCYFFIGIFFVISFLSLHDNPRTNDKNTLMSQQTKFSYRIWAVTQMYKISIESYFQTSYYKMMF